MEVWITEKEQTGKSYRQLPGILLEAALIFLANGIGTKVFLDVFSQEIPKVPFLLCVFVAALFCSFAGKLKKHTVLVGILSTAVVIGAVLAFSGRIVEGATWLWNQMGEVLGSKAGIYVTIFQQSGSDLAFSRKIFFIFLGMAVGTVGCFILKLRAVFLVLIWACCLPVLMAVTGIFPDTRICLAFYAGIVLELNHMRFCSDLKSSASRKASGFLTGTGLAVVAAVVAGIFLGGILLEADYQDSNLVTSAKEQAVSWLMDLRYQKGKKINSLPEGKLKETGAWTASDETALKVTMEQPASLYLRGFVGSAYDGSSWKSISTEDAYTQKNLFYWLHQDGFYGETQISAAKALTENGDSTEKTGMVTIQNEKASSKYLYTPYELEQLPEGYQGESPLTDSTLKARGLFGCRDYQFSSWENQVKDFTKLAAKTYQALYAGEGEKYREAESYYNAFVYQNDTALPGNLEALFRQELGDGGNREQGHTDYYTAISRIRAYLEKNMTYSSATELYDGKDDFTENFLTSSKIGHSVHFATAATLMFRYYGIPARYVEGYLITPEDISGKNSGDSIEISGKNGHAWTEIYLDGLGWIPLEMTPSYYGVMEEADLKTGLEAKGQMSVSIPETEEEPPADENIRTNWSLKLALFGMEKLLVLFLMAFDAFCLIFILTVYCMRFVTNYRRKKRFGASDSRMAVRAMAGYARELYEHGKEDYSSETKELYQQISAIGKKAAFSPHPITAAEKRDTGRCIRHMLRELKKARSWYDRWIMKYLERLY